MGQELHKKRNPQNLPLYDRDYRIEQRLQGGTKKRLSEHSADTEPILFFFERYSFPVDSFEHSGFGNLVGVSIEEKDGPKTKKNAQSSSNVRKNKNAGKQKHLLFSEEVPKIKTRH